jgi:hypothetical protein
MTIAVIKPALVSNWSALPQSIPFPCHALEEPTLARVIRALFDNTVAFLTTPGHPPTCMTLAGRWAAA